MDRHKIVETLAQLREELSQIDHVDPETLESLRRLTLDIGRLLDTDPAVSAAEAEPVSRGLKNLLLEFEAEHPQLSVAVGKVADALAAIGI